MQGFITSMRMIIRNIRSQGKNIQAKLTVRSFRMLRTSIMSQFRGTSFLTLSSVRKRKRMMTIQLWLNRYGKHLLHGMIMFRSRGPKGYPRKAPSCMMALCFNFKSLLSTSLITNSFRRYNPPSKCPKGILMMIFHATKCNYQLYGLLNNYDSF